MNNVRQMMDRQAAWQKTRDRLSWPEKIRQAEILRDACIKLRVSNTAKPVSSKSSDYTQWQAKLWPGQRVGDISKAAIRQRTDHVARVAESGAKYGPQESQQ